MYVLVKPLPCPNFSPVHTCSPAVANRSPAYHHGDGGGWDGAGGSGYDGRYLQLQLCGHLSHDTVPGKQIY